MDSGLTLAFLTLFAFFAFFATGHLPGAVRSRPAHDADHARPGARRTLQPDRSESAAAYGDFDGLALTAPRARTGPSDARGCSPECRPSPNRSSGASRR